MLRRFLGQLRVRLFVHRFDSHPANRARAGGLRAAAASGAGCLRAAIIVLIVASSSARATGSSLVGGGSADTTLQRFAVRVFLEGAVDDDYVRTHMTFVNYVGDRYDADVHILVTSVPTVIGGTEYTAQFTGRGAYAGIVDTLRYVSKPADPLETTRSGLLGVLEMGMIRYVARTPLGRGIAISYRLKSEPTAVADPWDYWHFRISTSGYLNGSENSTYNTTLGSFSVRRVTPALKLSVTGSWSCSHSEQSLPTRTITYDRRSTTAYATVVKSLGENWSAGGFASALSSSHGRQKTAYSIAPAIEYDLFPYADITTRECRFLYTLKCTDVTYHEMTIFNKTEETLWSESLELTLDVKKNWGTAGASVDASHYLHDTSKNRLDVWAGVSVELFKGFSLSLDGEYSRIHDEIDLPRGSMTDDDILLGLKSMASSYGYSASIGLSYNFGSKFTNVVNRRFGSS